MTRACMIMFSASSRDTSLGSRMPGCLVGSPPSLRSVQPTRSSVAQPARSSTVLMSFSPNFTNIFEVTPGTVFRASSTPSSLRLFSSSLSSCSRYSRARLCSSLAGSSSKPSIPASSLMSTSASSSTEVKPSDASNWPTTSSTLSDSMNTRVEFSKSAWRRSDSSCSVRMSISQPVSCEARRTFCPRRPIASDSWLLVSGTTTSIRSRSSSITTLATSAGASALTTKVVISGDQGMMSIFSPCNSLTTACTREPRMPTQAPTGSTAESIEITPIFASDCLDRDDAVIDFGHFLREQLRHELRMGAGEKDLGPAGFAPHIENIGADAVAVAEHFARQHLVTAHDGFAAAEIDNDAAIFDALDDAVDDVADAVLEFLILAVALGLAHLLHDHLLGRLGCDTAIFQRRQGIGDGVADLGARIGALRVYKRNLVR